MGGFFDQGLTKPSMETGVTAARTSVAPTYAAESRAMIPEVSANDAPPVFLPESTHQQPDLTQQGGVSVPPMFRQDTPSVTPKIQKPTFAQASENQLMNPSKPSGMTRAGFLVNMLMGGLQGALAGAGSRTFGEGAQRAIALPFQQARARQETQQGELDTQAKQEAINQIPILRKRQEMQDQRANLMPTPRGIYDISKGAYVEGTEPDPKTAGVEQQVFDSLIREGKNPLQALEAMKNVGPERAAKEPSRDDRYIAIQQKRAQGIALTPEEQAYEKAFKGYVNETKVQPGVARMEVLVNNRLVQVEDPKTGAITYMTPEEVRKANDEAKKKGGTVPFAKGTNFQKNAFTPKARFDDINRVVKSVDSSIGSLDSGDTQRGLIYQALQDPEAQKMGAASAFLHSKAYKEMNPTSRNYVNGILSLREQIMGVNQMLTGAAGTSDSRVAAIWNTLPNGVEPDSDNARRKLDLVRGMLKNLREAFPLIDVVENQQQGNEQDKKPVNNPAPNKDNITFIPLG